MKNIMFNIGLPRSGSTLLMNILNENPEIYTTGTCPTPYIFDSVKKLCNEVSEFIAMDMDVLDKSVSNFLVQGLDSWYSAQTNKPNIISKSRTWDMCLRQIFKIYSNPKIIVSLRDPRDIIVSFEKLLQKYPHIAVNFHNGNFEWESLDKRIETYCTDSVANLGRPLQMLPHVYEYMCKYPNSFFIFKWEHFCKDPFLSLRSLYQWMNLPYFEHDLNNIPPSDYVEHDAVYRSLVTHKTNSKFTPTPSQWKDYLLEKHNEGILRNLNWFYTTFYSEVVQ